MQFLYLVFILLTTWRIVFITGEFDECSLARGLLRRGFPRHELPDWVCLVRAESSYRTDAINTENADGSIYHRLFQTKDDRCIPGCECNVKSEEQWILIWLRALLGSTYSRWIEQSTDNIKNTTLSKENKCAKRIKEKRGFSAWVGWMRKCKGKKLPNLDHCFDCRSSQIISKTLIT